MRKRLLVILFGGCVCCNVYGCTSRNWFEGIKGMQKQDCYKLESSSARQSCLGLIEEQNYDRYQADRETIIRDR